VGGRYAQPWRDRDALTFSSRVPESQPVNALTRAVDRAHAAGRSLANLTESNPTRVGLVYPPDYLAALDDSRAAVYDPEPLGMRVAREAVATDAGRRGVRVDPERVVLTASTSEAYAWLFKLLCNPGDVVLVPRPSYPLFEHLARAECVTLGHYDLRFEGRWDMDFAGVDAAPARTKAVIVVSPNNPTGSSLTESEWDGVFERCARHGWALIVDEVFADYPLDGPAAPTDLASTAPVLTFSLGGASKTLGLPHVKLGWMVVGGPEADGREALERLEHIADTYLSVSTPVQVAAPRLFVSGADVRTAIHERVRANLLRARTIARGFPAATVLPVGGGWSVVIRVPAVREEEALVVALVEEEGVLVHPGYYFDFDREAHLVASLLPESPVFGDALERALRFACSA
jgi:alanine-synthesizing transaminase